MARNLHENEAQKQQNSEVESQQFTIDDLFDLYFPLDREGNGYMCMVFQAFLDDSQHKAQKLMVSAGFCGNREAWAAFRRDWKGLLTKHHLAKVSRHNKLTISSAADLMRYAQSG